MAQLEFRRWTSLIAVGVVLAALAGCQIVLPPAGPVPVDPDAESAEANASDAAAGAFPLFVGARWVYRNATPDLIPVLHPGSEMELAVLAEVRCRDAASGLLYECFVVWTRQGTEREVFSYVHRTTDRIELFAVETRERGAAPRRQAFGGELLLKPALTAGDSWSFGQTTGAFHESRVMGQETVPLRDTIHTLLGPYTNSFTGAWRVRSTFGGIMADAYGEGIVETWYSTSVGMVKRTAGSLFYELVEFRRLDEVMGLDAKSAEGPHRVPVGGLVVVQLRGSAPTAGAPGVVWGLSNEDTVRAGGVLAPLPGGPLGAFHGDLDGAATADTGTYVFQFLVESHGDAALTFRGRNMGDPSGATDKAIRFELEGF